MYGDCHKGKDGMKHMVDKNVRPLFEKLVSCAQREAGCADTFVLPKMIDLEPAVWEHLERLIKGNPKLTKCRNCSKHFNNEFILFFVYVIFNTFVHHHHAVT